MELPGVAAVLGHMHKCREVVSVNNKEQCIHGRALRSQCFGCTVLYI